jgi:hypothetical protein
MSRSKYIPPRAVPLPAIAAAACVATLYVSTSVASAQQQPKNDELIYYPPVATTPAPDPMVIADDPEPALIVDPEIKNWIKFQGLVDLWKHERGAMSSITEMSALRAYQTIIGMGKDAVPLILAQLEAEGDDPDQWFWALVAITEVNPGEKYQGNYRKMAQAWFDWAKDEGYAR